MLAVQEMHYVAKPNVFVVISKILHVIGCSYLIVIDQSQLYREPFIFVQADFRINIEAVFYEELQKIIGSVNHFKIFLLTIMFGQDDKPFAVLPFLESQFH